MLKRIKRLKINKLLKTVSIFVIVLISVILAYLLYREVMIPVYKEEKSQVFSYVSKPSIDYSLLLKPNSVYSSSRLGEGQYYLTKYIDMLQADFSYEFTGDKPAELTGYYEISAIVEGYTIEDKNHITIWEKKFTLIPKTNIAINDKVLIIKKRADIKLGEYNDFAVAVVEDSKAVIPLQLNVCMDVNLKVNTGKNQVETVLSPTISLALDQSYFTIEESNTKEEPGTIEETRKVQIPPNRIKYIIFVSGLSISIILLLLLLVFTKAKEQSKFTKKLSRIFKVHGSRLVSLSSDLLAASLDNCSIVRSIDDLVKISDEIGRPIMYEQGEDNKGMIHFYVLDGKRTYLYILKDIPEGSDIEVSDTKGAVL